MFYSQLYLQFTQLANYNKTRTKYFTAPGLQFNINLMIRPTGSEITFLIVKR